MMLLFPILSDTSDWNTWFDWVKRYSVLVGAFILIIMNAFPEHRVTRWLVRIMPFVLILNVLEAALLEFPNTSPLNGILLIGVAICVPLQFSWDGHYRRFGFRGVVWQAAYLLTLARLYTLNPQFEDSFVGLLLVIVLASVFCVFERDTFNYLTWRAYTLVALDLQDSLWPKLSAPFYPAWAHADNRARWHGTPFADAWLALNVVLVGLMIYYSFFKRSEVDRPEMASRAVAGAQGS